MEDDGPRRLALLILAILLMAPASVLGAALAREDAPSQHSWDAGGPDTDEARLVVSFWDLQRGDVLVVPPFLGLRHGAVSAVMAGSGESSGGDYASLDEHVEVRLAPRAARDEPVHVWPAGEHGLGTYRHIAKEHDGSASLDLVFTLRRGDLDDQQWSNMRDLFERYAIQGVRTGEGPYTPGTEAVQYDRALVWLPILLAAATLAALVAAVVLMVRQRRGSTPAPTGDAPEGLESLVQAHRAAHRALDRLASTLRTSQVLVILLVVAGIPAFLHLDRLLIAHAGPLPLFTTLLSVILVAAGVLAMMLVAMQQRWVAAAQAALAPEPPEP